MAQSSFGLLSDDGPELRIRANEFRERILNETLDLVRIGKLTMSEAYALPVWQRRWWLDNSIKRAKEENEQRNGGRKQ